MLAIASRKSGPVMFFIRLISLLIYTISTVQIIRFYDGQYLKESSSMTVVDESSSMTIVDESSSMTVVDNRQKRNKGTDGKAVRLLCWVLTDPEILHLAKDARDTWMQDCDVRLFMSSKEDKEFPAIGLNVSEGREHIAEKSKEAWTYIYKNHYNDAEFFVKADPDSYIVVENLKRYLANCNPDEPAIYGHNLFFGKGIHYVAGEAIVLARESLQRLVRIGMLLSDCYLPGEGEDLKTCLCLEKVGGYTVDTRDENGRETFLPPFKIEDITKSLLPDWYTDHYREPYGYCEDVDCLSDYPIVFHYVNRGEFYILDYLLRKRRSRFQSTSSDDNPQFRFNGTRYTIYSNRKNIGFLH